MSRSTICAVLFAVLILLSLSWFPAALAVKYLVDIVALGHSLAKVLLLLSFGLLLSLALKIAPEVPPAVRPAFLILMPILFVGAMAQYLWYCFKFGLKPTGWSAVARDGFWTMSRLDHSHATKSVLSFLPDELAKVTDVGFAFGAIFPGWLLGLGFLLFLLLLVTCFGFCLRALQTESPGRAVSTILCCFVLVKCVIDGGLLNPEVWAVAPVFCFLIWGPKGLKISAGLTLVYLLSLFAWKPGAGYIILLDWLPAALALSVPLWWEKSKAGAAALMLVVLAFPVIRYQVSTYSRLYPYALNIAIYGQEELKEGWRVFVVSPSELEGVEGVQDPNSGYFLNQIVLEKATTPAALCRRFGLELVRRPVSWYQGEMQVDTRLIFVEGELKPTPLIVSSKLEGEVYTFRFAPGVNRDLAISMLGPGLTVVHDFRLSYPTEQK